jgi:hypothetical protein
MSTAQMLARASSFGSVPRSSSRRFLEFAVNRWNGRLFASNAPADPILGSAFAALLGYKSSLLGQEGGEHRPTGDWMILCDLV